MSTGVGLRVAGTRGLSVCDPASSAKGDLVAKTEFDAPALRKLGEELQDLMGGYWQAFNNLDAHWPNAGKFITAEFLETVVDDRRNGLTQHGHRYGLRIGEFGSNLCKVADEFENADGENARKIIKVLEDGLKKSQREANSYSQATEKAQTNFGDQKNGTDGDGWNNSVSLSANDKNEDDSSGADGDDDGNDDSDSDDGNSDSNDDSGDDSNDDSDGKRNATGGGSPFD